jgi:dTDP-4-dehydrorhamnose 3,5-epimerase
VDLINIESIVCTKLDRINVKGGDVLHALKRSDDSYIGFGEAYFSQVYKGHKKAWKRHKLMTLNLIVPIGNIKFIFVDENENSKEFIIGDSNYSRLTVPPGIWFGFQGLTEPLNLLLNLANIVHDQEEVEMKNIDEIKYEW